MKGLGSLIATLGANWDRAARRGLEESPLSPAEVRLLDAFYEVGLEPRQQVAIGPFDADFLFPPALCVEVDGSRHDWERDLRRDRYFKERGIYTIRIPASEVFENPLRWALIVAFYLRKKLELEAWKALATARAYVDSLPASSQERVARELVANAL